MTYSIAIDNFVSVLQSALNKHYANKFSSLKPPIVSVMRGKKYDKVILIGEQRMVYCFVDRKTGGLLKGNWKRVEDNRERGNVYNSNPLVGCNVYGLDYLDMSNVAYQF
jgi:hypothetical protein